MENIEIMHLCPHCNKSHYLVMYHTTTCLATSEVWKDGVCEYHNPNTTTTTCKCLECGKEFSYTEGGNSRFDNDVLDASTLYKTINGDSTPIDSDMFVTGSIIKPAAVRDDNFIQTCGPDPDEIVKCEDCEYQEQCCRFIMINGKSYNLEFCSYGWRGDR